MDEHTLCLPRHFEINDQNRFDVNGREYYYNKDKDVLTVLNVQ